MKLISLSSGVNKQKRRIWGTENLPVIHETSPRDQKVTVWTEVCLEIIIGSHFFKIGKTVNDAHYQAPRTVSYRSPTADCVGPSYPCQQKLQEEIKAVLALPLNRSKIMAHLG